MKKIGPLTLLLASLFTGTLFSQETEKIASPFGVFAYAVNAKQLILIDELVDDSNARSLTRAVCPTRKDTSAITLTATRSVGRDQVSRFQYEAESDVPAENYCLLFNAKAHDNWFVWGTPDSPFTIKKRPCLPDISKAAEDLAGRKAAFCYRLGGYGTGEVELVEYASVSPEDRLAALMVIDRSLVDDEPRYSIARFPTDNPVWGVANDGNLHPEQFRLLFTMSDDPESKLWSVAIERDGPAGRDLILYQPVGNTLKAVVANHDYSRHKNKGSEVALR